MTKQEFNKTNYSKRVLVSYGGFTYQVVAVNFAEQLLALDDRDSVDPVWVRYENAELVK